MEGPRWLVSIHGTEVKILSASFPKDYLATVNSPFMQPNKRVVVFKSKQQVSAMDCCKLAGISSREPNQAQGSDNRQPIPMEKTPQSPTKVQRSKKLHSLTVQYIYSKRLTR